MATTTGKRNYYIVFLIMLTFFVISFLTNVIGALIPDIKNGFHLSLTEVAILPFAFFIALALLLTWIVLFAIVRKKIMWWKRLYLYVVAVYIFALPVVAVLAGVFALIIWLVPVWPFLLPQHTIIRNHAYAVKQVPTVIDAPHIALYKDYYLFDKQISNKTWYYAYRWHYQQLEVNEAAKTFTISATKDGRDTVTQFNYTSADNK